MDILTNYSKNILLKALKDLNVHELIVDAAELISAEPKFSNSSAYELIEEALIRAGKLMERERCQK